MVLWACLLAGVLTASDIAVPIAGWTAEGGSLAPGADRGAVLTYDFTKGGSATAMWTPAKPVPVKRRAALSLWIRADPEVKLAAVVRDKNFQTRRYPFEAVTLENPDGNWRQVTIRLAAESTGYGDRDHAGPPEGRIVSLGIQAEPRYPQAVRGSIAFDDVRILESPDAVFSLDADSALTPAPAGAAHLAPRFGVNLHGIDDDRQLDLARAAGFSFVRADLLWRAVERNERYRFVAADRLMAALDARGMGVLWILDYGHPQHGGDVPRQPNDVAAFARYAEAVAAHYRGRNVRYEIWNEPNIDRFWPPRPNAEEYAALAREAVPAIHRADPGAHVATGSLARFDLPFFAETLAAGGEGDAASVHPYRIAPPETAAADLPLLRRLIGPNMEIWDTEWGYASYDYFSQKVGGDGHTAAGRKRQAVLACREALTVWALGLPVAVWYDMRDDGDDPRNGEKNFGLVDWEYNDKPAMVAVRTLAHLAADRTFAGLVRNLPDGVHAMRLDGAGGRVFAVWNDQPDARMTLRLPAGVISAVNLYGEPLKVKKNEIPLSEVDGPVYLGLKLSGGPR